MTYLIIGNILSSIGVVFLTISSVVQDKRSTVFYQIFDCFFCTLSNIALGGFSGAVVTLAALIRNVLVYFGKNTHLTTVIIASIMTIIGALVNQHGFIGWLPIIASIQYTLWLGWGFTSNKSIKLALAINLIIWIIYDWIIMAFPAMTADLIILVLCVISYCKSCKIEKNKFS